MRIRVMEFSEKCPDCGKQLELQQISFKMAILICMDIKCPYPCYRDCLVINRSIENINKPTNLSEQLRKLEQLQNSKNVELLSETSLLLDLEELLSSDVMNSLQRTVKDDKSSQNLGDQNVPIENYLQNSQSLELPELDQFLMDLLT